MSLTPTSASQSSSTRSLQPQEYDSGTPISANTPVAPTAIVRIINKALANFEGNVKNFSTKHLLHYERPVKPVVLASLDLCCLKIQAGDQTHYLDGPIQSLVEVEFRQLPDFNEHEVTVAIMPSKAIALPSEIKANTLEAQRYRSMVGIRENMLNLSSVLVEQNLEKEAKLAHARGSSKQTNFKQLAFHLDELLKECSKELQLDSEVKNHEPIRSEGNIREWKTIADAVKNNQNVQDFQEKLIALSKSRLECIKNKSKSHWREISRLASDVFRGLYFETNRTMVLENAVNSPDPFQDTRDRKKKSLLFPSSMSSSIGRRRAMEDRDLVATFTFRVGQNQTRKIAEIRAIFDGHGSNDRSIKTSGSDCAQFVSKHMLLVLIQKLESLCQTSEIVLDVHIINAIHLTFLELNARYTGHAGTTANVCVIIDKALYIANLGDSGAVFVSEDGEIIPLSREHKPDDSLEQNEIKLRRGLCKGGRLGGSLAMSRAFGDFNIVGVSGTPTIVKLALTNGRLVQFCDGISDVLTPNQMGRIVNEYRGKTEVNLARILVRSAYFAGSQDNLSVIETKIKAA